MRAMSEEYVNHVMCLRCFEARNRGFEIAKNVPAQPVNFPQVLPCCWCGGLTLVQYPNGQQASQGYQIRDHLARVPCRGEGGVHLLAAAGR